MAKVKAVETSLVDAKYGRIWMEEERVPESAKLDNAPSDEPVFILRAQDDLALHTLVGYMNVARQIEDLKIRPSDQWFADVQHVVDSFAAFRADHPDTVKVPD